MQITGPDFAASTIGLAGYIHHGSAITSDPACVCHPGFDGQALWAKYYARDGDDKVHGMTTTADGGIVMCGETDADVEAPPIGVEDVNNQFKDATKNGLLMKVDPDGNLLWAKAYPSRWSLVFNDVTEAPDRSRTSPVTF